MDCCYQAVACNARRARGLTAWCDASLRDTVKSSGRREGFGTYALAATEATRVGGKVRSVGGLGTGGPSRFIVVPL